MRIVILLLSCVLLLACDKKTTLFTLLADTDTGIKFNNFIEEDADNNVLGYGYFYNGGGVAAADFNNDGLIDLYFTGNMVANKLYLNKGNLEFEDISEVSGTALNVGWKTGVSLVDINNDGYIDIYVCRAGAQDSNLRRNLLYVNNGYSANGIPTFTEKAQIYGLDDPSYTTQAVFFDYDKDGDTDCFLLNHSIQKYAGFSNLLPSYREEKSMAFGNKLLNNKNGRFYDVTDSTGIISNLLSFGLGINVTDFNKDGWDDIYISNDYNENDYLYINQKNGQFKEVIREATGHVSLYSMGTDAADINNDGLMDILTLDMLPASNERIKLTSGDDNYDKYQMLLNAGFHDQTMRNMLQLNNGVNEHGTPVFSEIGQLAGVSNTDWSWAALMADFDNDGWKDIFITNGYARDYTNMEFLKYSTEQQVRSQNRENEVTQMDIISKMPTIDEHNYIFRNNHKLTFTDEVSNWGLDQKSQSNGAIYADLDNDGDLDLVTNNVSQKASVYRNNAESMLTANFLNVQLESEKYANLAGTQVIVYALDSLYQIQNFMPVRGFQSAMWIPLHFGMGKLDQADSVKVLWGDGQSQTVKQVKVNQTLVLKYSNAKTLPDLEKKRPLFKTYDAIDFIHIEDKANDFRVQTLLPNMFSYQGPFMAHVDLNNDKIDDVYIGGAKGQSGTLWLSQSYGKWKVSTQNLFQADSQYEDSKAIFFDADQDGDQDLLVGSAGYQLNSDDVHLMPRLYINERGTFRRGDLPNVGANASFLLAMDIDHDGDQDVVIGNRVKPGIFPQGNGAFVLINNGNGTFENKTLELAPEFAALGMTTDAAQVDLDLDGFPEIVITTDWGAVQVFKNQNGKFLNQTTLFGLGQRSGSWNTLKISDLDGDGDMDLIVGNMGLNTQWNRMTSAKLGLYASDFDGLNRVVPVVTIFENGKEYPYPSRDELLDQLPSLRKKYTDYISYSKATIQDIISGEKRNKSQQLVINEFNSGVYENINGKFEFHTLPIEAQFAPVFAISLLDVNQDGLKDLILGGNIARTRIRIGKNDASYVQIFLNKGKMKFALLPQNLSGIYNSGVVQDFWVTANADKPILFVANNNSKLRSYMLISE